MLLYIVDLICVASFVFSLSVSFSVFVCVLVWMVIFLFWRGIGTGIKKKKKRQGWKKVWDRDHGLFFLYLFLLAIGVRILGSYELYGLTVLYDESFV